MTGTVKHDENRQPESGPRILFFSGGTALRALSRKLIRRTHNSVHVITPFDSGGSSAVLRDAFAMPAVGDIRNRLVALADLSGKGAREIFALFTYRLSKKDPQVVLVDELRRMAEGEHVLVSLLPEKKREVIQGHFLRFINAMPDDFDLRGASIGNIVLTAGYLANSRHLAPVIDLFSELAHVRGVVRPVVNDDLHLAAELEDGTIVVGQHLLTGKEAAPLTSRIVRVWLTGSLDSQDPVTTTVADDVREQIAQADLICFPIGSFYSSVVANLLADGVGEAVAANPCPKVFVPNPGGDPELIGHTVMDQVRLLRRYLSRSGAPDGQRVLDRVLVDSSAEYPGGLDVPGIKSLGAEVVDVSLFSQGSEPHFASSPLSDALIFMAD